MDINALIAQGENQSLKFKSAQVNSDSLVKEIVAFANTEGGLVLLGVEDSGLISGNRTATQSELMRLFQQSSMFHFDLQPVYGKSALHR